MSIDNNKTREDLVNELTALRQRVHALETAKETSEWEWDPAHTLQVVLNFIWIADIVEGQVVYRYFSSAIEQITGFPPDHFMNIIDTWLNIVHVEDRDRVASAMRQEPQDHVVALEYRIVRRDGAIRWLYGTASPTVDQAGKVIRLDGVVADITERKQAKKVLQESEERYRQLVELSPDAIAVHRQGVYVFVNSAGVKLVGADTPEQILGRSVLDFVHPDDHDSVIENIQGVLAGELPDFLTKRKLLRLDGTTIDVELMAVPIAYQGQSAIQVVVRDISERKQAEAERLRLQETLEVSLNEIYMFDPETLHFTYVNQGARANLGFSLADLQHMTPLDIKPEFTEASFREMIHPLSLGDQKKLVFETVHRRADGSSYPVEIHLQLVENNNDRSFVAIIHDITERKQAELQLRLLELAVVNANDAIVITEAEPIDLPGPRIVYVNQALTRISGYQPEQVIGRSPRIFQGPQSDRAVLDSIRDALEKKEPVVAELINHRKDGSTFWVEMNIVPVFGENGRHTHWVSIQRDTTERRQVEQALTENRLRLQALFDHSQEIFLLADDNARFVDANPAACRLLGYTREELLQLTVWDVTPHSNREEALASWQELITVGSRAGGYTLLRKDGSTVETEYYAAANIIPGLHLSVQQDISERKQAEAALRRSQNMLLEANRIARLGNWELDISANTLTISDEIYRIFGLEPQAFGKTFEDFLHIVHPDDRAFVKQSINEAFNGGKSFNIDHRIVLPDGVERMVHDQGEVYFDQAGQPVRMVGTIQDITERKQQEIALRHSLEESEHRHQLLTAVNLAAQRALIVHSPAEVYRIIGEELVKLGYQGFFWTLNVTGWLELVHMTYSPKILRAMEALTGLSATDFTMEPSTIQRQVIDEKKSIFLDSTSIPLGEIFPSTIRPLADKLLKLMGLKQLIYVPLIIDGKTSGILVVNGNRLQETDIIAVTTLANQAAIALENARLFQIVNDKREKLRAMAARLDEVVESERRRLARELHDRVGQNLTALSINLNVTLNLLPPDAAEKVKTRLDESQKLVEETGEHIRDVMAELRPAILDDYGLYDALQWFARQFSERTGITAVVRGNPSQPRLASPVETTLFRITQEALTNISRHAQATQVTISMDVTPEFSRLVISDDGVGFDMMAQQKPEAKPGWGLIIMRERAEAIGGHYQVTSARGKGTTITVQITR